MNAFVRTLQIDFSFFNEAAAAAAVCAPDMTMEGGGCVVLEEGKEGRKDADQVLQMGNDVCLHFHQP